METKLRNTLRGTLGSPYDTNLSTPPHGPCAASVHNNTNKNGTRYCASRLAGQVTANHGLDVLRRQPLTLTQRVATDFLVGGSKVSPILALIFVLRACEVVAQTHANVLVGLLVRVVTE